MTPEWWEDSRIWDPDDDYGRNPDALTGCLVWLGLLLLVVGFWLLVIVGTRWLL